MSIQFTKTHEWVAVDGDVATVGITDYAQNELGDIVFVQLPEVGDPVSVGVDFAEVESVKAVSGVFSPVGGEVIEVNEALADNPALVNESAYDAWFVKVKFDSTAELLSEDEYKATL